MTWIDAWRMSNAFLALIALIWLVLDLSTRAKHLTSRRLYLTLALSGFLIVVVEGSIEQIMYDTPPGLRTALVTSACIWTMLGLYFGQDDDK